MESTREIFTTKEVADYLSINEKQVYRLVRALLDVLGG
jgi:DNA-binding CsgD family transcriptional regulator